jgi:hypothetical protein
MGESFQCDDLDQLRDTFPGWIFGAFWITAASGPDRRRLWALRGPVAVTAWDAGTLAARIRQEEAGE